MHSSVIFAAGLATFASAFTQPKDQTWGPLLTPDTSSSVTQGKDFTVTWDPESHPTDGVTVSLVLCHGPGSNCQLSDTAIAEGIPAAQKSFDWKVPCTLTPGVQSTSTGYGMLVIVDGTGEFQYSTQFSVLENDACSSSGSSSTTTASTPSGSVLTSTHTTTTKGSSIVIGPPAYATGSATGSWGGSGNWTSGAIPTESSWTNGPGATWVSTSGSSVWTVTGEATATATYTASTLSTGVAGSTLGYSVTASGPSASTSPFTGGAAHVGSSIAGMVVAGAVAVFAL
ncbi:hypothetical protein H2200_011272 [Cladophialophora chaetospira]|uniref:Yeast cell wall synthesis Kre9/Knh1-like N-terminal domain-containing protein n=1 Tax=Cladophialophora chaetospira TaxID=386627 RepID=A0AA38X0B6_9EURO|nr:hypothetical protein H2200_011272 [Cladophialophora chaetospira]